MIAYLCYHIKYLSLETTPFVLMPTHASSMVTLTNVDDFSEAVLTDSRGQQLRVVTLNCDRIELQIGGLAAGLYVVELHSDTKATSLRFVKH